MIAESAFLKCHAHLRASKSCLEQWVTRMSVVQIVFFGCATMIESVFVCFTHAYGISRAAIALVLRREAICNALN